MHDAPNSCRAPVTGWRIAGLLLAWLAGVALQLHQAETLPLAATAGELGAALLLVLSGAALVGRRARGRMRRTGYAVLLLGAALAAHALTDLAASRRLADRLNPALEGHDVEVVATVAKLPQRSASGQRFRLNVESARWRGGAVDLPRTVAVGWYTGAHEDADAPARERVRAGQRWQFTLRLRQPHGNLNPRGFDYELYLFEQGIGATGYVRDAPAQLLQEAAAHPVERARQWVRDAIERSVADRRAAGVLAALAVGDQSAIDRDDWQLFRDSGIAHLVSISGLHITMFAWLAGIVIGALWRRSGPAMLRLATPHAARWGGLALATGYAIFSGWGVPAQRTVWMLALVTLLYSSGRRWPWPLILLAAAVAVTVADPWALLQPGFWLSFAAVGMLLAADQGARAAYGDTAPLHATARQRLTARLGELLRGAVRTQAIASFGLAPLTLIFFQQLSLVGLLANLVAVPLITLLITPLALLGTLAFPLWQVGAVLVRRLADGLGWLVSWPQAVWTSAAAPPWAQAAGLLGAVLLVLPLPWRLRMLALPLALPLLLPPLERPPTGRFELVAADVGQGTAVLVRTHRHLLVYDTGPQYSRNSDAGERVLLPLLRSRGERRIDRLVLSHRDSDHVGGARALLQALPVGELLSSLEPGHPLLALAAPQRRCLAGERWQWDGVDFEILHPHANDYGAGVKPNAVSCVLRVSASGAGPSMSALLTGDIEKLQEQRLAALAARPENGLHLASDVLIAPHHGSRTSSSDALLDAVQPHTVVFQVGYRNRFGHPAAEVLDRYARRNIRIVATPACGAWHWSGIGPGHCEREVRKRYWHRHGALGY